MSEDLTQEELDAADARDLRNMRTIRDDLSLPEHVRRELDIWIKELERRRGEAHLKRLQRGM